MIGAPLNWEEHRPPTAPWSEAVIYELHVKMNDDEWNQGFARCLDIYLAGDAIGEPDAVGSQIVDGQLVDHDFMVPTNAIFEAILFCPAQLPGRRALVSRARH